MAQWRFRLDQRSKSCNSLCLAFGIKGSVQRYQTSLLIVYLGKTGLPPIMRRLYCGQLVYTNRQAPTSGYVNMKKFNGGGVQSDSVYGNTKRPALLTANIARY